MIPTISYADEGVRLLTSSSRKSQVPESTREQSVGFHLAREPRPAEFWGTTTNPRCFTVERERRALPGQSLHQHIAPHPGQFPASGHTYREILVIAPDAVHSSISN
jgi:hypothetical protein